MTKTTKKKAPKKAPKKKAAPKQKPVPDVVTECVDRVQDACANGWTLEDLAQHLGTSFSTVSRWNNGLNRPSRNTAARLIPLLKQL